MKSRMLAVGVGALSLIGLAACGSDGGTGASPATTTQVQLSTPVYVTALPVATTTTLAAAVAADPANPGAVAGEQMYTVVSGDYLFGIAKKFCLDAATVAAYNAWPDGTNHNLFAGTEIKIPSGACSPGATPTTVAGATAATTATAATSVETTTTVDGSAGATYTVVSGDYLGGIATKNGTTVDAIVAANGWSDGASHAIYPGDKIKLPAKAG